MWYTTIFTTYCFISFVRAYGLVTQFESFIAESLTMGFYSTNYIVYIYDWDTCRIIQTYIYIQ